MAMILKDYDVLGCNIVQFIESTSSAAFLVCSSKMQGSSKMNGIATQKTVIFSIKVTASTEMKLHRQWYQIYF
jgi:hypothetical protein